MSLHTNTPSQLVSPIPAAAGHPRDRHIGLRSAIAALAALVALTSIQGAIFVVPTLPRSWLHQGLVAPFVDFTIPALALGLICGGTALAALVTVVGWPRVGGLVSMVAGIIMIGFELVEILVVGFTPAIYPTQPVAWLQVFYLLVGTAMAILGADLGRRN